MDARPRAGIALPVKDFWEFDALVTVSESGGVRGLDELDQIYHWTELIQSSPLAVERSVHAAIGGAYRSQGITTLELRFNPMKRNRGGERDLDHIIMAASRGLDRAGLEYPQVRAGLILMMDRTFDERQNAIIVEKAIRYAPHRSRRIDIAGGRAPTARAHLPRASSDEQARDAPRGATTWARRRRLRIARSREVVSTSGPTDRSRHLARRSRVMDQLREANVARSPTSKATKALESEDALREPSAVHRARGPFTIATDGPEMMRRTFWTVRAPLTIGALDETAFGLEPPRARVYVVRLTAG